MNFLQEFKMFIQRGNVIDLAVAVIIGAAFNGIVNSLVTDVFTPLLGLATQGNTGFSELDVTIWGNQTIKLGKLVQAVLNFFIISFCVFLIVKLVNSLHVQKLLAGEPKPVELTTQEKLLTEIRDLLKGEQGATANKIT